MPPLKSHERFELEGLPGRGLGPKDSRRGLMRTANCGNRARHFKLSPELRYFQLIKGEQS
jgi:hypothetical protein